MHRVTLTQFLIEQQRKGLMGAELRLLMEVVARAVKAIAVNVSKGALAGVLGEAGSDNVQGEAQKKLDVIANDILIQPTEWGGHPCRHGFGRSRGDPADFQRTFKSSDISIYRDGPIPVGIVLPKSIP